MAPEPAKSGATASRVCQTKKACKVGTKCEAEASLTSSVSSLSRDAAFCFGCCRRDTLRARPARAAPLRPHLLVRGLDRRARVRGSRLARNRRPAWSAMGGDARHAFGPVCEPLPSGEVACFTVADDGTEQLLTCRPTMVRDAMRGTRSCLNCGQKRVGVLLSPCAIRPCALGGGGTHGSLLCAHVCKARTNTSGRASRALLRGRGPPHFRQRCHT